MFIPPSNPLLLASGGPYLRHLYWTPRQFAQRISASKSSFESTNNTACRYSSRRSEANHSSPVRSTWKDTQHENRWGSSPSSMLMIPRSTLRGYVRLVISIAVNSMHRVIPGCFDRLLLSAPGNHHR